MGAGRGVGQIARTLSITLISRAVGLFRELIISLGFGLSRATDAFYQLSATPTYLMTYVTGPFATAYIAWANDRETPDEAQHLPVIARWLLAAALGLALIFWAAASVAILRRGGGRGELVAAGLIALACLAVAVVGLGAAVANAHARFGRAQELLFANNLGFVLLIGLAALAPAGAVTDKLAGAFCAAALVAAAFAWWNLGPIRARILAPAAPVTTAVRASIRRKLMPMLLYASLETGGFLATQALVLVLAAASGAGVTSAASLATRLCLTANGLLTNPLSNIAMVRLARHDEAGQRRFLLRVVAATVVGPGAIAAVLMVGRMLLPWLLSGRGRFSAGNAALLVSLIPGYALWLVAQGTSMMLSRLSFARRRARLFTGVTLGGYVIANLARWLVWRAHGFAPAIAAGAAVELGAALLILAWLWHAGRGTPVDASARDLQPIAQPLEPEDVLPR